MPRFQVVGFGKETKRKRVRIYDARNQDDAIMMAAADGTIVDVGKTTQLPEAPPRPATESQKTYANILKIKYHPDITIGEMSALIDEAEEQDQRPATERQRRYAKELGIKYPKNISVAEMSILIDDAVDDDSVDSAECNSCATLLWRILKFPFTLIRFLLRATFRVIVFLVILFVILGLLTLIF